MKRVLVVAVIAIAAIAVPATAGGPDKTSVLCWNKDFPPPTGDSGPVIRSEPKRCSFFEKGESSDAGAVHARR